MNVGAYLNRKKGNTVFKINESRTVRQFVETLNEKKVGALIVVDSNEEMIGIASERDVLRKGVSDLDMPVTEIMTPSNRVIRAEKTENILEVMQKFNDNKIRHLPVFDGKRIIGVVSIGDAINELLQINTFENEQLKNYILNPY